MSQVTLGHLSRRAKGSGGGGGENRCLLCACLNQRSSVGETKKRLSLGKADGTLERMDHRQHEVPGVREGSALSWGEGPLI